MFHESLKLMNLFFKTALSKNSFNLKCNVGKCKGVFNIQNHLEQQYKPVDLCYGYHIPVPKVYKYKVCRIKKAFEIDPKYRFRCSYNKRDNIIYGIDYCHRSLLQH